MPGQQLSFAGFEPSSELDALFFGLLLGTEDAHQILQLRAQLQRELGLTGKPIATERLHVSMHLVGIWQGLSQAAVRTAKDVGASFSKRSFEIVFDRAMSFAGNKAFVLCADTNIELASFHQSLGLEMKKTGIGRHVTSRFTPHMTLLYGNRMVKERAVEPVRWTVRDLILVHSLRGRGCSKYVHVAHWPLRN